MQEFSGNLIETLSRLAFPKIGIIDIIQIALIAFFVYQFMVWIKYTHAYTLLKGILVVLLFILIAYIFRMNTILWIFSNLASTDRRCDRYFSAGAQKSSGTAWTKADHGFTDTF